MRVLLLSPQGDELSDPFDIQAKPCYDQSALMRRYDIVSEICDAMLELAGTPIRTTMRMPMVSLK